MRVFVTGMNGYIGSVLMPMLKDSWYQPVGMDMFYFCDKQKGAWDIRDVEALHGVDAVIHLAALSNDPIGEMNPELTYDINYKATVNLAKLAKEAGVKRFIYSSSCSVYGKADKAEEDSPVSPITAYAKSKYRSEQCLSELADEDFSPVYLRNATAFGWSPNFRCDLVLNTMTCAAYTQKHINIVGKGTQWRPLCHVKDIARAFILALEAPKTKIHNQVFNVGYGNYQVRDIAKTVFDAFPGCDLTHTEMSDIDPRSYKVDFHKIRKTLGFAPVWSMQDGIEELKNKFDELQLTDFTDCIRINKLKSLIQEGRLSEDLRWK